MITYYKFIFVSKIPYVFYSYVRSGLFNNHIYVLVMSMHTTFSLIKLDLKLNKLQGDINNSLSMLDSLESELWDVASGLEDVSFEIELNK